MRVLPSNVEKPCSSAAMLWLWPLGVDDEDHRRTQQGGHLCRRSCGRPGHGAVDAPVEQPHHAFDHGDVAAGTSVPVQRSDQFVADQHRVEVAARPARRQRVVTRVDVVRTHLERRDPMSRRAAGHRSNPLPPWFFRCPTRARQSPLPERYSSRLRDRACLQATRRRTTRFRARSQPPSVRKRPRRGGVSAADTHSRGG